MPEFLKKMKRSGYLGEAAKTSQQIEDRGGSRTDIDKTYSSNIMADIDHDKSADDSVEAHKKRQRLRHEK
jgi:hypothetical protein